jgi:nucleotide-binding universal stress UspA family protein
MDTGSAAPAFDLPADHPQSLVFADDGEPAADAAWSWITSHDWQGWHLEIVTVRETLTPGGRSIGHARHVERRPPAEACFTASVHSDDEGDPRTVLLRRAAAALVVVGCHHRSHWSALWAGSTTEWLIVGTPFPLLVARHGHPSRTVAICVDGSIHARKALAAFTDLPWHADVDVALVAVDDGAVDVEAALAGAATALGRDVPMVRLAGAAKRAIPQYVRENRIDLVVVGTRGLTGIRRMAIGSTVAALLKDATANLLVAHVDEELDEH